MAIAPLPKAPGARGGEATPPIKPVKATIPKAGSPGWKAFTAARWHANNPPKAPAPHVTTPVEEAMSAYRQAVAALGTAVAPVDTAAIHAPYAQAEQTTGQLGQGYGQMLQQSGDAASGQYTGALNAAQQAAAQFGISAGAGANPTVLQNNGAAPIAAQTQANTASAAAATNQWQRLLEQASAGKVADATTARQGALDTARAGLAANIPTLIGNERDRAFQSKAQDENMKLAYTQLTAKQKADLAAQGIDMMKLAQQGKQFDVTAWLKTEALKEKTGHDQRTGDQTDRKIALEAKKVAAAQKKAAAAGIKGIPQINAVLKTAGTKGTKPVVGYKITLVASPNGVNAGAPNQYLTVKDPNSFKPPAGWTVPSGTAPVAIYGQASPGSAGTVSLATWNRALAIARSLNPGVPDAQLLPLVGARPKK